jgi:hypothetical protein
MDAATSFLGFRLFLPLTSTVRELNQILKFPIAARIFPFFIRTPQSWRA